MDPVIFSYALAAIVVLGIVLYAVFGGKKDGSGGNGGGGKPKDRGPTSEV